MNEQGYRAPEIVVNQKEENDFYYNGSLVNTWALGVILYILVAGCIPYKTELLKKNNYYSMINDNNNNTGIENVIINQNKKHLFNQNILDLMKKIFIKTQQRLTVKQLMEHNFYKNKIEL